MYYKRMSQMMMLVLLCSVLVIVTTAQTDSVIASEPQTIQIPATDELILVGSYYPLPEVQAPTVLLLHDLNGNRTNWTTLIEPLLTAGYAVVVVDLRGHGETGGEKDWEAAVDDVQTWLDWMQDQPGIQADGISIIGADVGGNLAVIGCGNDPDCVTAIVLSLLVMGCDSRDCSLEIAELGESAVLYLDELTVNMLSEESSLASVLLFISRDDLTTIQQVFPLMSNQIDLAMLESGHGTELLNTALSIPFEEIILWLDGYTPPNLTPVAIETLVAAGDPTNGETLFAEEGISSIVQERRACTRCHRVDTEERQTGPGLLNVGERAAARVDGQSPAVYLYHSIVAPNRYIVEGFPSNVMPRQFGRRFTKEQIADVVAYLLTLES